MARPRLIDHLVRHYPEIARDELLARIMCGEVYVEGARERDPHGRVGDRSRVEFRRARYVGRGGVKLERALSRWPIQVSGKVFLDAGSSTGGFTDCLLQHGAAGVHCVDTGYNQLDYTLRTDRRVYVHERSSIGEVVSLEPQPDAAVADLSLRSLSGVADHVLSLTRDEWGVFLVKPQYERRSVGSVAGTVGREELEGILRDVLERLAAERVHVRELIPSPIAGHEGNNEFLALVGRSKGSAGDRDRLAQSAVEML